MSQPPDRTDPSNLFDPFGLWKQSQQAMLESWSKSMTDAVNTAPYAEATGRMLDSYLTAAAPLRKMIDQTMTQLLNQLSLPSRSEVVSIAERMTNIELRLDDLDARLDEMLRVIERTASAVAALSASASGPASDNASAGAPKRTRARDRTPVSTPGPEASVPAATRAARAARTTRATQATTGEAANGSAANGNTTARSRRKSK